MVAVSKLSQYVYASCPQVDHTRLSGPVRMTSSTRSSGVRYPGMSRIEPRTADKKYFATRVSSYFEDMPAGLIAAIPKQTRGPKVFLQH